MQHRRHVHRAAFAEGAVVHHRRLVVLHVVIGLKDPLEMDVAVGWARTFGQKLSVAGVSGREIPEFRTVRPRVQIPGPRPVSSSKLTMSARGQEPPAVSQIPRQPRKSVGPVVRIVGRSELGRQRPAAPHRLPASDASGWTVRHAVRNPRHAAAHPFDGSNGQRLEFQDLRRTAQQVLLVPALVPAQPSNRREKGGDRVL